MIFESQYHLKDEAIGVPSSIFTETEINSDSPIILNYWREHCFECAPPLCYQSCNNYLERTDGKCRLLKNGISPVKIDDTNHFRVRFRKWAKIESYGAKYSVKYGFYDQISIVKRVYKRIYRFFGVLLGMHFVDYFGSIDDLIHSFRLFSKSDVIEIETHCIYDDKGVIRDIYDYFDDDKFNILNKFNLVNYNDIKK